MNRKKRNSAAQSFLSLRADGTLSTFEGNCDGGTLSREMSGIGGWQEKK